MKILAQNRKARHNYEIVENIEAGIVLMGSEVKAIRVGKASIGESFVIETDGELFLHQAHISPCLGASYFSHEPLRNRKLLLKRRQINKVRGQMTRKHMTVVPLKIYANARGIIKVDLGIAHGRQKADKREAIKEREWKKEQGRILKNTRENV
jgi:SsrA-binding protein